MAAITVRARDTRDADQVIFDQATAGLDRQGNVRRVVIRANGKAHQVNGALKVVKDAIERGELIQVGGPTEDAPAKAEK